MSFKKNLTLILALILATGFPMAMANAADGEYVFITAGHDNPYWTTLGEGIKDGAKAKGVTAIVYEAKDNRDVEGELNLCLTALLRKPKIVVMGSLNASIAIQCFKKAAQEGIMVADIDATLSVAEAEKAGIKLAFSIGSDNTLVGEEAAKYVAAIAAKPDPKIFVLEGLAGSIPGQKRVTGFKAKIQTLLPRASIVASLAADWDRLKAMTMTLDLLQRQPDIDIIYAANDTMALGATEAVRNLHRDMQIKIIGVDGTEDARKAVREGRLTASVAQLPYLMGLRSVDLAIEATAAHTTGRTETTATPVLTKELIEANKDPILRYVR